MVQEFYLKLMLFIDCHDQLTNKVAYKILCSTIKHFLAVEAVRKLIS